MKCFGYGEVGHRKADCKKIAAKKTLFVDIDECDDYDAEIEEEPVYDDEAVDELHVEADVQTALVVRQSCLTLKVTEETDWLQSNIFQSTCTINVLEKAEEPKIKLPTLLDHGKSKRVPEKHLILLY